MLCRSFRRENAELGDGLSSASYAAATASAGLFPSPSLAAGDELRELDPEEEEDEVDERVGEPRTSTTDDVDECGGVSHAIGTAETLATNEATGRECVGVERRTCEPETFPACTASRHDSTSLEAKPRTS